LAGEKKVKNGAWTSVRFQNMKKILKPSLLKIMIAFALVLVSSMLWRAYIMATISDTFPMGFPLQFFLSWGPCKPGNICSEFNGFYLVLDVIFWYSIGAFLVSGIQKYRGEQQNH
jgi:hypothetical protein